METYTVQPGDTLSGIAEKTLGSPGKWRLLADLNQLANPERLKIGQVLKVPPGTVAAPNVVNMGEIKNAATTEEVRIVVQGKTVFAVREGDGQWVRLGNLHRNGLSRIGEHDPESFIKVAEGPLKELNLTESEIRVMLATSENEGNLDAINTYDDQFLSFGMFQWTAGGADAPGELAALLQRIKTQFPEDFDHYWGRFGLDVADVHGPTGWLSLNGKTLRGNTQKSLLRQHLWAYRFAVAGADDQVKAAQIAHAVGRLESFYFMESGKLQGYRPADVITSEFGVALLLDNHVNRPGYVLPCVAKALEECGMTPKDLVKGGDDEERRVLEKYLKIRKTHGKTPMTNAASRAEVTRRYVARGLIADRRGSFKSSRG